MKTKLMMAVMIGLQLAAPGSRAADDTMRPEGPLLEPKALLGEPPKAMSMKGRFTLNSVGNLTHPRPLMGSGDAELMKVARILQSDDMTLGNQEGPFFDFKTIEGSGQGFGLLIGEPGIGLDQKAMGIDMVSVSNNHGGDWGPEGLLKMQALLDQAGIRHAGGGRNRQEAYGAGFIDTPKGRVGLVATTSTFKVNANALDATADTPARAGISVLRTRRINLISAEAMADLRAFAAKTGVKGTVGADEITVGGQIYRVAESADAPAVRYEMNLYDHVEILKAIRAAKQQADMVIFTIHAHETPTRADDGSDASAVPPNFLPELFRDAIDAGADVIVGGGIHHLRGIEIYKGKPVLHGLGVFILRGDRRWMPDALEANAYPGAPRTSYGFPPPYRASDFPASNFDSVIASTVFEGNRLREIRLHPIDVGQVEDWSRRGVPHLADRENAERILAMLQKRSAPFGTKIEIKDGVGIIRP